MKTWKFIFFIPLRSWLKRWTRFSGFFVRHGAGTTFDLFFDTKNAIKYNQHPKKLTKQKKKKRNTRPLQPDEYIEKREKVFFEKKGSKVYYKIANNNVSLILVAADVN